MEDLDISAITQRSVKGIFALVSRTFFIKVVSVVVGFILYIFLTPSQTGVFLVVSAVIAFLQYFSDIGLAGALIQKKEAITQEDLETTFTIQQGLVISGCFIVLFLSSVIGKFYKLDQVGMYLFYSLVISFFLSSLKTIPSILLERDLRFDKLVIPEIVETLVFNLVILVCAIKGMGVMSFAFGVLARGVLGLITIYLIKPWRIKLGFSRSVAKKLLSFGIPFQANSMLALIKDDAMIAYIGKMLPLTQVGYIGFAQKWAMAPLQLIMNNVIRITFPSFSRLQHDEEYLGVALEKSLFVLSFLIFPSLVGLAILFPYFIQFVPRYQKWQPALLSLTFFTVNAGFSSISTPLTNALNAIGKIKISLYFMIFWTIATWVITPLFLLWFGFNGFAAASAVIATSVVIVVYITKKYIRFSIVKTTFAPLIASALMGILVYCLSLVLVRNIITLCFVICIGAVVYGILMFLLAKKQLLADFAMIRKQFENKER